LPSGAAVSALAHLSFGELQMLLHHLDRILEQYAFIS